MCGISGKLNFDHHNMVEEKYIQSMSEAMTHRGPDDTGIYLNGPIGFGHNRLSIIDLETGKQPISNEEQTIWIVFNGEIYNYRELRKELISKGHVFRTNSDTEVIVHLFEESGVNCLSKLKGMFAFALWDEKQKLLFLARDRVGIKPLYYTVNSGSLEFASEIKALCSNRSSVEPDLGMIDRFLTYYYVPGDRTLFKGIYKLEPGNYIVAKGGSWSTHKYWDLDFSETGNLKFSDTKEELLDLINDKVRSHMISDVPVGLLLSGGIDSTALLSFAVENTVMDISTFTIGFSGHHFADERPFARMAATKYGTNHYEATISAQEFQDLLPTYIWHMEEPVCEPSGIALYIITKLAREHVKVLISGEGADEAFAGYQNYRNMLWIERIKKYFPPARLLGKYAKRWLPDSLKGGKLEKWLPYFSVPLEEYYLSRTSSPFNFFNSHGNDLYSDNIRETMDKNESIKASKPLLEKNFTTLQKMLYVDTKTWLPDDLLIKADKLTMANSVELRVPFLDHEMLEFAARLPSRYKIKGLSTKHILKKALKERVPREILYRRKTGFPVPYETWLKGDMLAFSKDLLLDKRTIERGCFDRRMVESMIHMNQNGRNLSKEIFSMIVLELWYRVFVDGESPPSH